MPKRKAEGPPETEVENTLGASEITPIAESIHTRSDRQEDPSTSHLSQAQEVPATGQVPDDHPFWELLAILGYDIW